MCNRLSLFFAAMICACVFSQEILAQDSRLYVQRQQINEKTDLLTIFGELQSPNEDVPLVSVLFETKGDDNPANDRPRYIWSLTYTPPAIKQRIAAAIPFFYHHSTSKRILENKQAPPPIFDFSASRWRTIGRGLWRIAQLSLIDDQGFLFRAAPRSYGRNANDHRQDHLQRTLAILYSLESSEADQSEISTIQLQELQARLAMSGGWFNGLIKHEALSKVAQKNRSQWEQARGRNWELLRQRAEAEGLYFEPLMFVDGAPTHAILWVARQDLLNQATRKFDNRFLNIANPYSDNRLREWNGYVDARWLDENNRQVEPQTPGANRVELIPLALYGLDHPRIPILLIDFRDESNAKVREISRRVTDDLANTVFRLSPGRNFSFWAAKKTVDLITKRLGNDFNQPSRLKSFAELDLLLMLDDSIDPLLRAELMKGLRGMTINPMENSLRMETRLAHANYEALLKNLRK